MMKYLLFLISIFLILTLVGGCKKEENIKKREDYIGQYTGRYLEGSSAPISYFVDQTRNFFVEAGDTDTTLNIRNFKDLVLHPDRKNGGYIYKNNIILRGDSLYMNFKESTTYMNFLGYKLQ